MPQEGLASGASGLGPAEVPATGTVPPAIAFVPLPPEHDPGLQLQRKVPRRLHLWFAVVLGLVALSAALAQGLLNRPPGPAAAPVIASTGASVQEPPPLAALKGELARQSGTAVAPGTLPTFGQGSGRPGRADAAGLTSAPAAHDPASGLLRPVRLQGWSEAEAGPAEPVEPANHAEAALAGVVPPELLAATSAEDSRRYEQDKARALIAGSRILALNHAAGPLAAPELPDQSGPGVATGAGRLTTLLQSGPAWLHEAGGWLQRIGESGGAPARLLPRPLAAPASVTAAPSALQPALPGPLVMEGTPIPCVLLTELRSDLPGMIVAQVSEDVFDTLTAQLRVIPRGTRLIGRYDSQVSAGQQRLFASFHRLILPDGASVELEHMEAADRSGTAGLQDQVDTHFWRRFGNAFLTAGLAGAADRRSGAVGSSVPGGVLPGPDATGQILVETARSSLQATGALPPTLVIRRGQRFHVMVNRDLALPEFLPP
jgi:hypothetical protein